MNLLFDQISYHLKQMNAQMQQLNATEPIHGIPKKFPFIEYQEMIENP